MSVTVNKTTKTVSVTVKKAQDGKDGSDASVTKESIESALGYTPADAANLNYTVAEAFSNVLTFDKNKYTDTAISQSAAIAYSLAASGHKDGIVIRHKILSDGVNTITFPAEWNLPTLPTDNVFPSGLHIFWFAYFGGDVDVSIPTYTPEAATEAGIYDSLSNVELILDDEGLATSTDNEYGTVDASGNVTTWKSLAPAPTGRDFTVSGTAPTLTEGGVTFGGAGNFVNSTLTNWKFLHYNADATLLKWTKHLVIKIGNVANPDTAYGLLGNNAAASANVGVELRYDDRSAVPTNNAIVSMISNGSGQIYNNTTQDVLTPNAFMILTLEYDHSLAIENRGRLYINGTQVSIPTVTNTVTALSSADPTHPLDIGALGNSQNRLVGNIRTVVLQSGVETSETRTAFIDKLKTKYSIA